MSTVVCRQGVQPCIESTHVVEATTMRLKLVAPKCDKEVTRQNEFGGWSYLQSLSSQKPFEKESSYVHPWVKQSSLLKLSPKSLELCTESLGSETGSDMTQGCMFLFPESRPLDSRSQEKSAPREERNFPQMGSKKVVSRGFPPPLTTISSSNLLHVRPHREGGRLIIEALEAPTTNSCFQAERSHGRLRLMCWKSEDENLDLQSEEHNDPELKNDTTDSGKTVNDYDYDYGDEEEDEEDEYMEMNGIEVDLEMEKQKFQRPSRCKEDGHGDKGLSSHWEPFWLATS